MGLSGPDSYITSICRAFGWDQTTSVYGYIIWVHYGILWLFIATIFTIKKILRKEKFSKYEYFYLFSMLVPVFLTGPLVSINNIFLHTPLNNLHALWSRYLLFLTGMVGASIGASMTVWANMLVDPHSALVMEVNDITKIKIFIARVMLDLLFFVLAIIIGLSTHQEVFGFDPNNISADPALSPLISYTTIIFVAINGVIFGTSLKILNKFLGSNK